MSNILHPSNALPTGEPKAARWPRSPQRLARSVPGSDGFRRWNALGACALALGLLTACGGGQAPEGDAQASPSKSSQLAADPQSNLQLASQGRANAREQAILARGAQINQQSLIAAEQQAQTVDALAAYSQADAAVALQALAPGAIAAKSAYAQGHVARKALALSIPVYRFFNTRTGSHFYTTSETEKANVLASMPFMTYDGPAFSAASAFSPGLSPVHRFYNTRTGVHFYTISETERASVAATLPHFTYEGVAYHASQVAGQGFAPLYRFFVPARGFHFYTASEAEKLHIQSALMSTYGYEGVGYHVLASNWRAEKLPHTGVPASQCYREGDNVLVTCNGIAIAAALLNPQQDGHRTTVNPMSYSEVVFLPGGTLGPINYSRTSCVRDNVTGLVWEGKTDDGGLRDKDHTYTHLGNNAANDTSGYVAAVNASNLCGFNNWRMPSVSEIQTLVDYSKNADESSINSAWFPYMPNRPASLHWTSDLFGVSEATTMAFVGPGGWSAKHVRGSGYSVRLVRGSVSTGPRFSHTTIAYPGDAASNLVNDASTGLQWRRCVEGQSWTGASCAGTPLAFSQEGALLHARAQAGWRLPNLKELGSLVDRSRGTAPMIDVAAFPQTPAEYAWSTTPHVVLSQGTWYVDFNAGTINNTLRSFAHPVRLVRINP